MLRFNASLHAMKRGMRATESQRNAESLRGADDDIRTPVTRRRPAPSAQANPRPR